MEGLSNVREHESKIENCNSKTDGTRLPGEVGIWYFVVGDLLMFTLFFGLFAYYRSLDVSLYDQSQLALNANYGFANTLILLLSSLFVVLAVQSVEKKRNDEVALKYLWLAIGCGLCFMLLKVFEYHEKISHGISLVTNDFFMYYFILTGLHLLHVIIGTSLLAFFVFGYKNRKIDSEGYSSLETRATFWHMVDLLWILIFPLLYLVK